MELPRIKKLARKLEALAVDVRVGRVPASTEVEYALRDLNAAAGRAYTAVSDRGKDAA